jgi:type IV pilus assembly protein PilX
MKPFLSTPYAPMARQQIGVTLIIAIVFLLVMTALGIASMRGVSLDSRITANLKQQKTLTAAAEAGLRMGELSAVATVPFPCDATTTPPTCVSWKLNGLVTDATVLQPDINHDTPARFSGVDGTKVITSGAEYGTKIQWYLVYLNTGPLLGNAALTGPTGTGSPQFYEVNSCASTVLCTSDTTTPRVILRSVFAQ